MKLFTLGPTVMKRIVLKFGLKGPNRASPIEDGGLISTIFTLDSAVLGQGESTQLTRVDRFSSLLLNFSYSSESPSISFNCWPYGFLNWS